MSGAHPVGGTRERTCLWPTDLRRWSLISNLPYPVRHRPRLLINTEEIRSRLQELASADLCDCCLLPVTNAIIDIGDLLVEVNWLYIELVKERLRSANLEAAIHATLDAYDDGEADPLGYVRDEIVEYLKNERGWE